MIKVWRDGLTVYVHDEKLGLRLGWDFATEQLAQASLLEKQQQAIGGGIICQAIYCGRDSHSIPQKGHELMAMLSHTAHLVACLAEAGARPDVERLLFSFGLIEETSRQQLEAFAAKQNAELQQEVMQLRQQVRELEDTTATLCAANTALDLLHAPSGPPAIRGNVIDGECKPV